MKTLLTKLYLLIAFISFCFIGYAQNNLPPVYEIKNDTALYQTLDNAYYQLLEDSTNKLTIREVMQTPVANRFHHSNSATNAFDFRIHTYWFRYILKNEMSHDAKINFLSFEERSDFYLIAAENKLVHKVTGTTIPLNKETGVKIFGPIITIPVVLKPGEKLISYKKVYNTYNYFFSPRAFSIGFFNTEKLNEQSYSESQSSYSSAIHDSILFGVLSFAALISFFFFLIVRERVYFYFSLYMLDLGLGRIAVEFYFIFFRNHPVLFAYIFEFIWSLSTFFMTLFIRSLLQTKMYVPRWNRFLTWLNYLYLTYSVVIIVSTFENPTTSELIQRLSDIVLYACNLLSFLLVLNKSRTQNKILLIAVLPAFAIWAVGQSIASLYQSFGFIVISNVFTVWIYNSWFFIETFCLSWLAVFYSWILLHRFSELRKQIAQHALERERERSTLITQQKAELEKTVDERTTELKQSLEELKSTQAQLIHQEKMASLGELTAGIAHEIQNPLNFVNNFSDVNKELLTELKEEADKGNIDEVKTIANDVIDNEEKINHHGKRADAIVKGMLQHSKQTKGIKEPTDINALCDEYLRLAYHGMRAKDKNFNAEIKTDFDDSIGKINIVPQDIGRVLLNLFNNAFYAVSEKQKTADENYKPLVTVATKSPSPLVEKGWVEVIVTDNGNGIPQNIIDKIFQPFFTTKPTGEGTGLGLSLAYDIITKEHNGTIKVESKEGEGSEFIIQLPMQ